MNLSSLPPGLSAALDRSSDLISICNFKGYFTNLNSKWEDCTGYTKEELKAKPFSESLHPEDLNATLKEAQDLLDGKRETINFENRYIRKDGEIIWLQWNSVVDLKSELIFSVTREITVEKKRYLFTNNVKQLLSDLMTYANEKLHTNEYISKVLIRLLSLYEADSVSFWDHKTVNGEGLLHCSHSVEKPGMKSRIGLNLFQKNAKRYFNALLNDSLLIASDVAHDESMSELKNYTKMYKVKSLLDGVVNEGLNKRVLCIETSTQRNWTDQETNTLLAIANITSNFLSSHELVNTNNELRATLNERNILFKELHHRIKNNLNMVSNMLSLKSLLTKDSELDEFVKETKNRIYSISKTHDQLLKMEEFDRLHVREYILDLTKSVINTYTKEPSLYPLNETIENVNIKIDLILAIGLLTNEIISNIIKYAYDPKKGGEIFIRFATTHSGYSFEIGDKGKGIQNKKNDSLGLKLIHLLVKQHEGIMEINSEQGLFYKIKFPFKSYL